MGRGWWMENRKTHGRSGGDTRLSDLFYLEERIGSVGEEIDFCSLVQP